MSLINRISSRIIKGIRIVVALLLGVFTAASTQSAFACSGGRGGGGGGGGGGMMAGGGGGMGGMGGGGMMAGGGMGGSSGGGMGSMSSMMQNARTAQAMQTQIQRDNTALMMIRQEQLRQQAAARQKLETFKAQARTGRLPASATEATLATPPDTLLTREATLSLRKQRYEADMAQRRANYVAQRRPAGSARNS